MHKFSRLREDEYLPRVSMKTLVISQTCTLTFFYLRMDSYLLFAKFH